MASAATGMGICSSHSAGSYWDANKMRLCIAHMHICINALCKDYTRINVNENSGWFLHSLQDLIDCGE
ncbi:exported hypothetical protein [Syntrophaceticus schinkii]|uniref:Uncharacterized protein n=1 Tax=Syntrophaceticus schinkii TaxID=499207 RepID=A0A0B7MK57_9FIRM|nr:exported hypothetical protein [Syntrophaceticus schinkii]